MSEIKMYFVAAMFVSAVDLIHGQTIDENYESGGLWEVPPPWGLGCNASGFNSLTSLSVTALVDPSVVDGVSFMVARANDPERWPFLQYSVPVESPEVRAVLPALGAGGRFLLMARAHKRGEEVGWYKKWSKVAHLDTVCTTPATVALAANHAKVSEFKVRTRWAEFWRLNGPMTILPGPIDPMNNVTLPDYLENHNAFPSPPVSPALLTYWGRKNYSVTRYCVAMADVTFDDVFTPGYLYADPTHSKVHRVTSKYADYLSCNGGKCDCMICGDRVVFLDHEQMKQECPTTPRAQKWIDDHYNPNATSVPEKQQQECNGLPEIGARPCNCHNHHQSLRFVGMAGNSMFSFPVGGRCGFGKDIGDEGCTWKEDPLTFSTSMGRLIEKGVFDRQQKEATELVHQAFRDLGAQPCPSDPPGPTLHGSPFCEDHPGCADLSPLDHLCCPVADGTRLACCGAENRSAQTQLVI
eukprot:TRINITY_DN3309_c0_g1_i1.p1 TRINITY_DN3309_c0_g1~~TRINITY_DN3309_c0_g1_i1.p1  ORF type:complete len:468 (-),score=45.78 TRINITY_DN3309_c0_g1_i1:65-1468(-)